MHKFNFHSTKLLTVDDGEVDIFQIQFTANNHENLFPYC